MPLYRPSELSSFLASLGIHPKKGLSQNFLIDGNILKKITALAAVQPGDVVIEIGPGPGALTEELLASGCRVIAIEKDPIFAKTLSRLQNEKNSLTVYEGDILDFDFAKLATGNMKVVANIPYHLTSPIIERLIANAHLISSATLMVQEEVARRCTAEAGKKEFGHLSLFVQFHALVRYGFHVPAKCFYPTPQIDSAVIHMDLQKRFHVTDEAAFFQMTRMAFGQRRKMIRSTLGKLFSHEKIEASLKRIGKDVQVRPEMLSCAEWVQFYRYLFVEVVA